MTDRDPEYQFAFYERVRIVGERPSLDPVRGELAAVLGRASGRDGPSYAVHVYTEGLCWDIDERDLEPTGEHDRHETFYDDSQPSLRVSADGDFLGFRERRGGETHPSTGPSGPPPADP